MFQIKLPRRRSLTVTTISDDIARLERLEQYLHRRVWFRAVPELEEAIKSIAASDAIVFYPDSFAAREVQRFFRRLIRNTTLALVIVVTERPEQFQALTHGPTTANRFIVLAEPTWPWELFATIQAGLPCPRREETRSC